MRPRPRPRHLRTATALLLSLVLLIGTGCTEVEETLSFDSKGGGTYRLVLRRDADLWQRVGGVLGKGVLARIEGRSMEDGLELLPGVRLRIGVRQANPADLLGLQTDGALVAPVSAGVLVRTANGGLHPQIEVLG